MGLSGAVRWTRPARGFGVGARSGGVLHAILASPRPLRGARRGGWRGCGLARHNVAARRHPNTGSRRASALALRCLIRQVFQRASVHCTFHPRQARSPTAVHAIRDRPRPCGLSGCLHFGRRTQPPLCRTRRQAGAGVRGAQGAANPPPWRRQPLRLLDYPTLRRAWSGDGPGPQCAFKVSMFNVSCNSH